MYTVHRIPAFTDNYIWALERDGRCVLVDPGDAAPCEAFLEDKQFSLDSILITHHHFDHVGGLDALCEARDIDVHGPLTAHDAVNRGCAEGDTVTVLGLAFRVIAVPGHTLDHLAFFGTPSADAPILFCGDTLFAGGCGRLFEGSPEQMHQSLSQLMTLPPETKVYCAHEYTEANLRFAMSIEPGNPALQARYNNTIEARQANQATVPSNLDEELKTNPFLRWHSAEVRTSAGECDSLINKLDSEIFAEVRRLKDNF